MLAQHFNAGSQVMIHNFESGRTTQITGTWILVCDVPNIDMREIVWHILLLVSGFVPSCRTHGRFRASCWNGFVLTDSCFFLVIIPHWHRAPAIKLLG